MSSYSDNNVVAVVERKFIDAKDAQKLAKAKLRQARCSGDDEEEERCGLEYDAARERVREPLEELLRLPGKMTAR